MTKHKPDDPNATLASGTGNLAEQAERGAAVGRDMYVSHIALANVRRFERVDLPVLTAAGQPRRCTVFIGRNGTCKTTLLRCIALGLCDSADTNSLVAEPTGRLLAACAGGGSLALDLLPPEGGSSPLAIQKEIREVAGKEVVSSTSAELASYPFVCAYGAGRFGTREDPPEAYRTRNSVMTLFDYGRPLHGIELTLRRLKDLMGTERFEAAMTGLKRALGLTGGEEVRVVPGGGVELSGLPGIGRNVPLAAWADGYRLTFTWLLDLYAWAFKANRITSDGHVEGIVLVDELEHHLHPSMQASILPKLMEVLPRVQWFVTTHSPLVALGAQPGEVVRLREEGSHVVAEPAEFDFSGYSAEDMLVDGRLFDTIPYAPATAEKLERYRELVAKRPEDRTQAETEELRGLARELRSQQLPEVRGGEAERELLGLLAKHGL